MTQEQAVRPGQVWADNDKREAGRTVYVDTVDESFVYGTVLTCRTSKPNGRVGHATRIRLGRFNTGFRLITEATEVSQ